MSTPLTLARPELRELVAYQPARYQPDCIRLNANEAPWRAPHDESARGLNIYPPPRPFALAERLAAHYGVDAAELLVTRGSSEAIDVLIRAFCACGRDAIVICPPTFGMYQAYAAIQGASVVRVPLRRDQAFALDETALAEALCDTTKLIFLCSPNNPTGHLLDAGSVARICAAASGRALVVIDEAYVEFSDRPSLLGLRQGHPHVVILRTLSKAYGLAGARCGALIADPAVVDLLSRMLPPYGLPTPTMEAAMACLEADAVALMRRRIAGLVIERERVARALAALPSVSKVYPSAANFVLVESTVAERLVEAACRHGILIRDFSRDADLPGCVRITIGNREQNDLLLRALGTVTESDHA